MGCSKCLLLLMALIQSLSRGHADIGWDREISSTPVIGGPCQLDSPDVHIGGKQTQFFLRCEPTAESAPGEGVWVVKSRNAGTTASKIPAAAIALQQQNGIGGEQAKKMAPIKTTSYVCDLVSDAQEHGYCTTSENCLQPVYTDRTAFLQCDPTIRRWVKKHCQLGFNFDFERQACIAHTAKGAHFRQFPSLEPSSKVSPKKQNKLPARGIVCTYAQCSMPAAPCNIGHCNNGYCCSAAVGALPTANLPDPPPSNQRVAHTKNSPEEVHDIQPILNNPSLITSATSNSTSNSAKKNFASPPPIPSILVIAMNDPASDDNQQGQFQFDDLPSSLLRTAKPFSFPKGKIELCSSGFHSPLRCSFPSGDCPLGLTCESVSRLCCPLPPSSKMPQQQQKRSWGPPNKWAANGAKNRRRMALRRHLLGRKRFASFCSPCMPVQLLVDDDSMTPLFSTFPDPGLGTFGTICPTGSPALGPCAPGFCVPPLQCAGALCCAPPIMPMPPPPPPPIPYAACPGGLPALGPCIGGRCATPGTICASPANVCCAPPMAPAAIPATVCPDGTQAAGACVNGQCGAGFTCNQGLCCTNSSQTPRCLDGSQSIGACIQGKCGTGYTCTTGNICCPSQLNLCPPGQTSIGQAVNGRCPAGYTNYNGQCCGSQSAQSQVTCSVEDSSGPCDSSSQCPEPGYACDVANNWCCPQVVGDAIGPCIQGEGGNRLCPEGYACVGEGEGQCFRLDTGTCPPEEQAGPCAPDGSCPPGYECIEGFCCQTDTGPSTGGATPSIFQKRRKRHAPSTASTFLRLVRRHRK